jgi:hypothetical protein
MIIQVHSYQLQIDNDKFLITKRLFQEMFAEINYLVDYTKCRSYVRATMSLCTKEITEVNTFKVKKIDIQL